MKTAEDAEGEEVMDECHAERAESARREEIMEECHAERAESSRRVEAPLPQTGFLTLKPRNVKL